MSAGHDCLEVCKAWEKSQYFTESDLIMRDAKLFSSLFPGAYVCHVSRNANSVTQLSANLAKYDLEHRYGLMIFWIVQRTLFYMK